MFRFADIADVIPFQTPLSGEMAKAIELWMDMYMDRPPWKTQDVQTMNLPSLIASELARIATIEMKSEIAGGARARYLNDQYQQVIDEARKIVEYAAAGGSLALKPYICDGRIIVEYVRAGMFWPTAYSENGAVIGCSFVDQITKGDKVYVKIESQSYDPREKACTITNKAYRTDENGAARNLSGAKEIPLTEVEEWADIEPSTVVSHVARPLFAILQMPVANNIEPGIPLGVSCYARAVELIKEADKQFSRLLWEMESGQRAMYVDITAFKPPETREANGVIPFKRLYRTVNIPDAKELFSEWSPELREANQIAALDEIMRRIEDACGLARGTISSAPEGRATNARSATELRIMRQRTYAVCVDMQKEIKKAFTELIESMNTLAAIMDTATPASDDYTVTFDFDDSVVSDRDKQFMELLQLMDRGIYQPEELRVWYFGEEIKTAAARVREPPDAVTSPGEE